MYVYIYITYIYIRMPYGYRRYIFSYIPQLANLTNLMDHQLLPLFNATPGGPGRQHQARDPDLATKQ